MHKTLINFKKFAFIFKLARFAISVDRALYLFTFVSITISFVDLYSISWLVPLSNGLQQEDNIKLNWYHKALTTTLGLHPTIKLLLAMFLTFTLIRIILSVWSNALIISTSKKTQLELSSRIFKTVLCHTPVKDIEAKSIGYFISLGGDQCAKSANILLLLFSSVSIIVNALLYYFYLSQIYLEIFLGISGFFLISAIFMVGVYLKIYRYGQESMKLSHRAGTVYIDGLNNLRTLRALASEKYLSSLYRETLETYLDKLGVYEFLSTSGKLFPLAGLLFICLGWLAFSGTASAILLPKILVLTAICIRLLTLVGQSVTSLSRMVGEANSCADVLGWLQLGATNNSAEESRPSTRNSADTENACIETIEVKNLTFAHTAQGTSHIKNLNLKFVRGKKYAIIGPSGGGKSTLLDLLAGTYTDYSGEILFNGMSVQDLSLDVRRGKVLMLTQSSGLFNTSVKDNVVLGNQAIKTADLTLALEKAAILDHVNQLPSGINSLVSYQGNDFSGGQRQRLAIARVFARQPDVVLLDEATSALDKAVGDHIMQNITDFCKDKILIFVTHHIEQANQADVIYRIGIESDLRQGMSAPNP